MKANSKRPIDSLLFIIAAVLILISIICIARGFYFKNDYDAYDYIINGLYFAGYAVLGSAAGLGAIIVFVAGLYFADRNAWESGIHAGKREELDESIPML